jgi:uncharacterized protein YukE
MLRDRVVMIVGATLFAATVGVTACSTTNRDTNEAAGDVVLRDNVDSVQAQPAVRWLTDANLLSLLGMMNARQIAAADVELEAWHVDSVRAFAAAVAQEHAELQHAADSVSDRIHVAPIAPALARTVATAMQSQIDSLRRTYGRALDRAFVREQVGSQQFMAQYTSDLAAVAERPEMRSLLASVHTRITTQLAHARALQRRLAIADSIAAADSTARLAARALLKHERRSALP